MDDRTSQGDGESITRNRAQMFEENLESILEMISGLKAEIRDEWERVKRGESDEKALLQKIKADMPKLLNTAIEQETRLHDQASNRAGRAGAYALDLGQSRVDIGRRLALLRAARGSGELSGEPQR